MKPRTALNYLVKEAKAIGGCMDDKGQAMHAQNVEAARRSLFALIKQSEPDKPLKKRK